MNDDIVTRLRIENYPLLQFGNHQDWCTALGIMDEAADEIESLRAIIKWFQHTQICSNYGKKQCWECVSPANQKSIMKEMFD